MAARRAHRPRPAVHDHRAQVPAGQLLGRRLGPQLRRGRRPHRLRPHGPGPGAGPGREHHGAHLLRVDPAGHGHRPRGPGLGAHLRDRLGRADRVDPRRRAGPPGRHRVGRPGPRRPPGRRRLPRRPPPGAGGAGPVPGPRRPDHHLRGGPRGGPPGPGRALAGRERRRRLLHHLHLRHHRQAQGRGDHPPHGGRPGLERRALDPRPALHRGHAPAAVPAAGALLRPVPGAAGHRRQGRARPHPRRGHPAARPQGIRPLLRAGGAPRHGEDLQRRGRQGRGRPQAQDLPLGRQGRHRVLPRPGRRGRPLPSSGPPTPWRTGSSTAASATCWAPTPATRSPAAGRWASAWATSTAAWA